MKRKISMFLFTLLCLSMLTLNLALADSQEQFIIQVDQAKPTAGDTITVTLSGKNVKNLYAYEARLQYDQSVLKLQQSKSELKGFSVSPLYQDGQMIIAHTKVGNEAGDTGDFNVGKLTFKVLKSGETTVSLDAMKIVDQQLKSTTAEIDHSLTLTIQALFKDIAGHWAEVEIVEAAGREVVNGFTDQTFRPGQSVTRAQFAVMLSRALQLPQGQQLTFSDAAQIPDWAQTDVAKAVQAGIIKGYGDGSFRGEQPISRAEIAVMVARGMKLEEGDVQGLTFTDRASIPDWAQGSVKAAVDHGIIQGRTNNRFVPHDQATRAEAATLLVRMLTEE